MDDEEEGVTIPARIRLTGDAALRRGRYAVRDVQALEPGQKQAIALAFFRAVALRLSGQLRRPLGVKSWVRRALEACATASTAPG
jgi:hypothetical protein